MIDMEINIAKNLVKSFFSFHTSLSVCVKKAQNKLHNSFPNLARSLMFSGQQQLSEIFHQNSLDLTHFPSTILISFIFQPILLL